VDNKEKLETARKKIDLEELQKKEDLRKIVNTPEGVRFFKTFFGYGRLFNPSFVGNTNTTFFNEGKRNLALRVLSDIGEADAGKLAEILINLKD